MTENEAIELIEKDLKLHSKDLSSKYKNCLRMAIQALEEIKAYRAIGTVEEFKALKENTFFNFDSPLVRIDEKSYNKAIDEFVSRLEKHEQENWIDHQEYGITWTDIEQVAKELKGGGNSDN